MNNLNYIAMFCAGAVIAGATTTALHINEAKAHPNWRTCAPAQNGQALVSTVQYEDKTECFYVKASPKGKAPVRKEVI